MRAVWEAAGLMGLLMLVAAAQADTPAPVTTRVWTEAVVSGEYRNWVQTNYGSRS